MTLDLTDILLRLGAAAAAGMLLGINRDLQNKPIGTRTLGMVGLGTAVVAVSSIQFPGMAENPTPRAASFRASSKASWPASASSAPAWCCATPRRRWCTA